jgi:hypothetical protein
MALVLKDRVKETTNTTGTSDAYALGGAATGFQTFTSVLSNADTTYYCCTDGTSFEVGLGTFASSGPTLARTTILESSNSNNPVDWGSGTRDIFITQPAEKAVFLNADGHIDGDLTVVSTDAGASEAPALSLYRNSASPATDDDTGAVIFNGENSADEKIQYVRLDSRIGAATDGAEYGRFGIDVMTNGSSANYYLASFDLNQFYKEIYLGTNVGITFEGSAYNDHETTITATNPTADRTITLPDATGTAAVEETGGLTLNNGVIALKNGGTQSEVRLYCESSNAHYAALKAPAHADFAGNVTSTLPSVTGTLIGTANADAPATTTSSSDADHVLVNDNGVLKKITPSNLGIGGGGGSNADTVDNYHVSVVSSLPGSPDSNTIYFVTGSTWRRRNYGYRRLSRS